VGNSQSNNGNSEERKAKIAAGVVGGVILGFVTFGVATAVAVAVVGGMLLMSITSNKKGKKGEEKVVYL
jgi:hypothetical protein